MKHARPDYDRIQDPAGRIPADDPVLLFRAQDKHAAAVARFHADLVERGLRRPRDRCLDPPPHSADRGVAAKKIRPTCRARYSSCMC